MKVRGKAVHIPSVCYKPQHGRIRFPGSKSSYRVIYTGIIYLATENWVTAAFPVRSRVASERLCPNLKESKHPQKSEGEGKGFPYLILK